MFAIPEGSKFYCLDQKSLNLTSFENRYKCTGGRQNYSLYVD